MQSVCTLWHLLDLWKLSVNWKCRADFAVDVLHSAKNICFALSAAYINWCVVVRDFPWHCDFSWLNPNKHLQKSFCNNYAVLCYYPNWFIFIIQARPRHVSELLVMECRSQMRKTVYLINHRSLKGREICGNWDSVCCLRIGAQNEWAIWRNN